MNSNKRKILEEDTADNSDIFKNRPSSTMANLSYVSNVIHTANLSTGHGSFREAFILDDEVVISKTPQHVREFASNITVRRNARNKKIAIRSVDSRLNLLATDLKDTANFAKNLNDAMVASTLEKAAYETYKSSSRLASVRPKLSEICNKTEKPEKRHESSKDVILPETGKIFDKQNEFSDEIDSLLINHTSTPCTKLAFETDLRAIVLVGSENSPVLSSPARAVSLRSQKAKNKRLEGCNENEGRPNNESCIVCTPKAWTKRRSQSDGCTNSESSLKRRLFSDTVVSGETRPYESALARDSNDFESPVPNGRLERRNIARCSVESIIALDSPILSDNRRKGNRSRLPLKSSRNLVSGSYYTREPNAPAVFRNNLDSSASRTWEGKNVLPVVLPSCSFHVATPQKPVRRRESITNIRTDLGEDPACRRAENRSIKEPVSMEMTPIPPIADPVVKLIRLENLPRTILARHRTSIADDKSTEQNRRRESIGDNGGESTNVVRTFINENVCEASESIAIVKGGKPRVIKHSIVWKAIPPDNDRRRVRRRESAEDNFVNPVGRAKKDNTRKPVLDLGRRCTSTTRSSLRVNTSLDSLCESVVADKRPSDSSSIGDPRVVAGTTRIETEQGCNFDSSNNLSTIEKLRNVSVATITSVSCEPRVGGESEARRSIRTIPNEGITAAGVGRTGRIGSTRLVRRAPLLESRVHDDDDDSTCQGQTRAESDNDSNENYTDNRENPSSYLAKDKRKTLNARKSRSDPIECGRKSFSLGTTILDDTPRSDEKAPDRVRDPVVIEDSTEEMNSFASEKEKVAADRASKRGKKKLLPLRDSQQLVTFSPLQSQNSSASASARTKPRRRRRNRAKAVTKTRTVARADEGRAESRDIEADEVAMVRTRSSSGDGPDTPRIRKTKLRKPRKVISKKIVVKKTVCLDVSIRPGGNGLNSAICNSESATRRRSTDDFSAKNPFSAGTRRKRSRKIFIVTTGLIKSDKGLVKSIVKFLGSAEMEASVTRRTTHVVSAGLRTANLLRGIIRGCWLVSLEWVLASLECKRWLDPTRFEMAHFSKAVRENRGDRQLFGDAYVPELFATCGFIYIENATTPPTALLKELIKTAGGRITDNPENAKIIVGSRGLKEIWVLDSITTGDIQPLDRYYRN